MAVERKAGHTRVQIAAVDIICDPMGHGFGGHQLE